MDFWGVGVCVLGGWGGDTYFISYCEEGVG